MVKKELIEIEFDQIIRQTDMAVLACIDDKEYWLPKSQIDFREWSNIIGIPEWLAIQKGLV